MASKRPVVSNHNRLVCFMEQRRLRHLTSITARNMVLRENQGNVTDIYFTLHMNLIELAFYTSEKLPFCPNLDWKIFDPTTYSEEITTAASYTVVKVWGTTSEEDIMLLEWVVHFSGLVCIGEKVPRDGKYFQPCSLAFGMQESFYVPADCLVHNNHPEESQNKNADRITTQFRYRDLHLMRKSYNINSVMRLHTVQRAIKQTQGSVRKVRQLIVHQLHETQSTEQQKSEFESLMLKIKLLKDELTLQQGRLKNVAQEKEGIVTSNQEKAWDLMGRYQAMKKDKDALTEIRRKYYESRENYLKTHAQLTVRRKQLITELSYIYPITEVPGKGFTICGVRLPNSEDFQGRDDISLSVALGYVCHHLNRISHFLNIPLRYPITLYGSRSGITDHIKDSIPDKDREFPLYARSKHKAYFDYGVYLLNKDIAQLRHYFGLSFQDLRATLPNLYSLLELRLILKSEPAMGRHSGPIPVIHAVPGRPSYLLSPSVNPEAVTGNSGGAHSLMEQAEQLTEHTKLSPLPTPDSGLAPAASVRSETENSSLNYENKRLTPSDSAIGASSSTGLSGSLDQGLNKIGTIQSRYVKNIDSKYHKASRRVGLKKLRRELEHHGSEPNLNSELSLAAGVIRQHGELYCPSSDDDVVTAAQRGYLDQSTLKVWTAGSSQTTSDDEFGGPANRTPSPGHLIYTQKHESERENLVSDVSQLLKEICDSNSKLNQFLVENNSPSEESCIDNSINPSRETPVSAIFDSSENSTSETRTKTKLNGLTKPRNDSGL